MSRGSAQDERCAQLSTGAHHLCRRLVDPNHWSVHRARFTVTEALQHKWLNGVGERVPKESSDLSQNAQSPSWTWWPFQKSVAIVSLESPLTVQGANWVTKQWVTRPA